MNKRVQAVEYIRGIAMLGVIGIHTGSYALANPTTNKQLFILLEILSRFSVPIFFFVAAFGSFMSDPIDQPFSHLHYLKRRLRSIFFPFLTWSLLYLLYQAIQYKDYSLWETTMLWKTFFFGLASYHLYFLVILMWFDLLMPLWRWFAKKIIVQPIQNLLILLSLQIIFNYYSSYILEPVFTNAFVNLAIEYRYSFWVWHYLFIFMLGSIWAIRFNEFNYWITQEAKLVNSFLVLTIVGMTYYYYRMLAAGFSLEETVNTIHQLSPIGVLHTFAATLSLYYWFHTCSQQFIFHPALKLLAKYSYPIYLCHPFLMTLIFEYLVQHNIQMTARITISFYIAVLVLAILSSWLINYIGHKVPLVSLLLLGTNRMKE